MNLVALALLCLVGSYGHNEKQEISIFALLDEETSVEHLLHILMYIVPALASLTNTFVLTNAKLTPHFALHVIGAMASLCIG